MAEKEAKKETAKKSAEKKTVEKKQEIKVEEVNETKVEISSESITSETIQEAPAKSEPAESEPAESEPAKSEPAKSDKKVDINYPVTVSVEDVKIYKNPESLLWIFFTGNLILKEKIGEFYAVEYVLSGFGLVPGYAKCSEVDK